MSNYPWPPRPDVPHDPTAEICTCDECELPRYEAWADKIDAESAGMGCGLFIMFAIFVILVILIIAFM